MKFKLEHLLVTLIFALVGATVYSNIAEDKAVDQSKLPEKVEKSVGFQKWITNLKNKDFVIEADEFRLDEENEVYNTERMIIYSIDEDGRKEELAKMLEEHQDLNDVEFSPSERQFIDYRHETRGMLNGDPFKPNDIHYYGLRDDKIIDSRILTCNSKANCYFDRAYFLDNNVFVISLVERADVVKDQPYKPCSWDEICQYKFKLNVIDLINNSNLVYESEPFEMILNEAKENF